MQYCKYHPLQAATFHCSHCNIDSCDKCVDINRDHKPLCLHCQQPLDSLGSSNNATPFWRRLPESFRYPLNTETGILLVAVSFLTSVLGYVPLGVLWVLMVTGAFFKYSMSCLEKTAHGEMTPPDITSAYGGGLSLLFQLFLIMAVMGAAVVGAYVYLGSGVGGLLGTLMVIALPAVIINFAITESVFQALNPTAALRIVTTIGLPYGVLMAFLLIMFSSVGVISSLLGDEPSFWLAIIQSIVSNYYMLVVFHIMGYMIFQYQREFGFFARHSDSDELNVLNSREKLLREVDVNLKEGNFSKVLELYSGALNQHPSDSDLYDKTFNFLCGTKDAANIGNFSDVYFKHLKGSGQLASIRSIYTRVLQVDKQYMPEHAAVRHLIAKSCVDCGDFRQAAKLLNGLHKQHPDYFDLSAAYLLMSNALSHIPNMSAQSKQYLNLSEKIKIRAGKKTKPETNPFIKKDTKKSEPSEINNKENKVENSQEKINAEKRAAARKAAENIQRQEQKDNNDATEKNDTTPSKPKQRIRESQAPSESLEDIFNARSESNQK